MPATEPVRAAMRDASWHNRPGVAARYHVAIRVFKGGALSPACNPDGMILNEMIERDAAQVPEHMRGQRPGCKQRWPSA